MAGVDVEMTDRVLEAIKVVAQHAPVRAVYIFGSQVQGAADEWSDVDVDAFVEGAEKWDIWERARMAGDAMLQAGHDIELHFFPADKLEHAHPASFAAYVQKHGLRVDTRKVTSS